MIQTDNNEISQGTEQEQNNLFPVFLKLDSLKLLIIGAGTVGYEKLNAVVQNTYIRNVKIVATSISAETANLAGSTEGIILVQKEYSASDMDDIDLVICAVNNPLTSSMIRADARSRGLLINVADKPSLCDFYLSAVVHKGHLKIAISTNGKSPTLAKRLKEILSRDIPDNFHELIESTHRFRQLLNSDLPSKVQQLNSLTRSLVTQNTKSLRGAEYVWKKVAYTCIIALAFLFIGNALAKFITIEEIGIKLSELYKATPKDFYITLVTGFAAQMVDGALGMGYGVTCTSVLLAMGVPPAQISGGIHTAEMFSSGASGLSHYKFGNVNKKLFRAILIPAIAGAFAGAYILSKWGEEYSRYFKPVLAAYTFILGVRILYNAFRKKPGKDKIKNVAWLGFGGGFLDSIGGGGWGPLVTSTLISKGRTPKYVIGTISLTEFFVTLVSALTFFMMIGISHWQVVTGLIIGGVLAAPIAARLNGKLPQKVGFIAIGILVIVWSLNTLSHLL